MARECKDCKQIRGDECTLYTGPSFSDCGLVNGLYYKINDLINALLCAANNGLPVTTTTTSTSTTSTTSTSTSTSTTTTTTTIAVLDTSLTFVSDTYSFQEGVSGQVLSIDPVIELEFNKVEDPIGLYSTMNISVGGSPVMQVNYRSEYTGHSFRFTNSNGNQYNGVFGGDINF